MLRRESFDADFQHVRHATKPFRVIRLSLSYLYEQLTRLRGSAPGIDRHTTDDRFGNRPNNPGHGRAYDTAPLRTPG